MKKIIQSLLVFILALNTSTAFALSKDLSPFDEIILSGNVSALLVEGTTESIDIKNDRDRLEVEVSGSTLKIKAKDLIKYNKTPTIKVVITYKTLRSLRARAGSSAYTEDAISGDKLELKFSSGASGELEVVQNSLEVAVSEGGNLKVKGETDWQKVKVATGGTFFAYKLDANNTVAKANTGGNAKVVAYKSIDASANTGGTIIYKGDPKKVREKDGFSGTVKSY
jgi:hypothetical protein